MSGIVLILLATVVAFGWSAGVALVTLPLLASKAPRGWALRELAHGRARNVALMAGLLLLGVATVVFVLVESAL